MNNNGKKIILDVCCGGRMFWFDKKNPDVLFLDIREEQYFISKGNHAVDNRHRAILPDKVMDFRKLDLPAESFNLVVFDPPHLTLGRKSYYAQIYGSLGPEWKDDLTKGFAECFRVLKKNGILIFKWNESEILLKDILALTPVRPLFGHRSGKAQKTHWVCFMKLTPQQGGHNKERNMTINDIMQEFEASDLKKRIDSIELFAINHGFAQWEGQTIQDIIRTAIHQAFDSTRVEQVFTDYPNTPEGNQAKHENRLYNSALAQVTKKQKAFFGEEE